MVDSKKKPQKQNPGTSEKPSFIPVSVTGAPSATLANTTRATTTLIGSTPTLQQKKQETRENRPSRFIVSYAHKSQRESGCRRSTYCLFKHHHTNAHCNVLVWWFLLLVSSSVAVHGFGRPAAFSSFGRQFVLSSQSGHPFSSSRFPSTASPRHGCVHKWKRIASRTRWTDTLQQRSPTSTTTNQYATPWIAGANVEGDFKALEGAIQRAQAPEALERRHRIQHLQAMAWARRPLTVPVVVWKTTLVSWMIAVLFLIQVGPLSRPFWNQLVALQFWTLVVMAPLCLMVARTLPWGKQKVELPHNSVGETTETTNNSRDARPAQVLLREWVHAVLGIAIVGVVSRVYSTNLVPIARWWWSLSRILVRVGAAVSLQQWQSVWFTFCHQQYRPYSCLTWCLQQILRLSGVTPKTIPWMLAIEVVLILSSTLSRLGSCLPQRIAFLTMIYGLPTMVLSYWVQRQRDMPPPSAAATLSNKTSSSKSMSTSPPSSLSVTIPLRRFRFQTKEDDDQKDAMALRLARRHALVSLGRIFARCLVVTGGSILAVLNLLEPVWTRSFMLKHEVLQYLFSTSTSTTTTPSIPYICWVIQKWQSWVPFDNGGGVDRLIPITALMALTTFWTVAAIRVLVGKTSNNRLYSSHDNDPLLSALKGELLARQWRQHRAVRQRALSQLIRFGMIFLGGLLGIIGMSVFMGWNNRLIATSSSAAVASTSSSLQLQIFLDGLLKDPYLHSLSSNHGFSLFQRLARAGSGTISALGGTFSSTFIVILKGIIRLAKQHNEAVLGGVVFVATILGVIAWAPCGMTSSSVSAMAGSNLVPTVGPSSHEDDRNIKNHAIWAVNASGEQLPRKFVKIRQNILHASPIHVGRSLVACFPAQIMRRTVLFSFVWIGMLSVCNIHYHGPKHALSLLFMSFSQTMIDLKSMFLSSSARFSELTRHVACGGRAFVSSLHQSWGSVPPTSFAAVALASIVGLVGPIGHMIAFSRLVQIRHTHNLPLTMDPEEFNLVARNDPHRFQWRCYLKWRDPTQQPSIGNLGMRLLYYLSVYKTVDERLKLGQDSIREEEFRLYGPHILRRVENESIGVAPTLSATREQMEASAIDPAVTTALRSATDARSKLSWPDRSTWKSRAMEQIAQQHHLDYEQNIYDDPLGMAVYKTFGIGLGFRFDHMSELDGHDYQVSIRRLQARAAKSAVHRAQVLEKEVTRTQQAVTVAQINSTMTTTEREELIRRATTTRDAAALEKQTMALMLTNFIPSNGIVEGDVGQFSVPNESYGRGKFGKYGTSPVVQALLAEIRNKQMKKGDATYTAGFTVDYMNPMADVMNDNSNLSDSMG